MHRGAITFVLRERRRQGKNYTYGRKISGTKCQIQKGEVGPCPLPPEEEESRTAIGLRVIWREGEAVMGTARNLAQS